MIRTLALLAGTSALGLALVGCRGDGTPSATSAPSVLASASTTAPESPSPTEVPSPSATPVARSTVPAGTPWEVVPVLEAIFSGDPELVAERMSFTMTPCSHDQTKIGAPPRCPEEEPEGTRIPAFPGSLCEPWWLTRESIERDLAGEDGFLDFITNPSLELYGVSRRLPGAESDMPTDRRVFTVVFVDRKTGAAGAATVEGGSLQGWRTACGESAEDLLGGPPRAEVLLPPPPGTPRPYPLNAETGEAGIDRVINAVRQQQIPVLESLLETRDMACQVQPHGGFPAAPQCLSAMAEGTVIPAFLLLHTEGRYVPAAVMRSRLEDFAKYPRYLLAVKRFPLRADGDWNRDGAIVFWSPQGDTRVAYLHGDQLSALWFVAPGQSLEHVFDQFPAGEWLLPPR